MDASRGRANFRVEKLPTVVTAIAPFSEDQREGGGMCGGDIGRGPMISTKLEKGVQKDVGEGEKDR